MRQTHAIQPLCISGHYFRRHGMFQSDKELGTQGSLPLHMTGKFSYLFLIKVRSISEIEHHTYGGDYFIIWF